jgi:hypothetical protein
MQWNVLPMAFFRDSDFCIDNTLPPNLVLRIMKWKRHNTQCKFFSGEATAELE